DDLDAPIEIARHQVRAADERLLCAAVAEVPRAAVLQEAADDAPHADVVADARHAGTKNGDAADEQIDLHARLRRAVQQINHTRIDERIHFQDDVPGLAALRPRDFPFDERLE